MGRVRAIWRLLESMGEQGAQFEIDLKRLACLQGQDGPSTCIALRRLQTRTEDAAVDLTGGRRCVTEAACPVDGEARPGPTAPPAPDLIRQ